MGQKWTSLNLSSIVLMICYPKLSIMSMATFKKSLTAFTIATKTVCWRSLTVFDAISKLDSRQVVDLVSVLYWF